MQPMRDRFYNTTAQLVEEDPRVMVVLADIGVSALADTNVIDHHPERIVNVGIREQLMIGAAAGIALEGYRPIVHSYAPFLVERPYEQVKLDLGHQDVGAVLVSVGASYDTSAGGRTHHAPADVALLGALPGWTLHVPGHPDEVEPMLRRAIASGNRTDIRLSTRQNTLRPTPQRDELTIVRRGSSGAPTVIAVGPMLDSVAEAAADRDVTLLYAYTVRPFDRTTLRAVLDSTDVVLVEPYLAGTSASVAVEALHDRAHRLLSLGVRNLELRRYGTAEQHDTAHGLDAPGIRRSLDNFLNPDPARRTPYVQA